MASDVPRQGGAASTFKPIEITLPSGETLWTRIPPELMVAMHISRQEEKKLNVDEEMTDRWRGLYGVCGSDAVEDAEKELAEEAKTKKRNPPMRRERAPSLAAIIERRSKSQRKI